MKKSIVLFCIAGVIILFIIGACKKENEMDIFLRQPPPVMAVTQEGNVLKFSWNEVEGADSYYLQGASIDWTKNKDKIPYVLNLHEICSETFFTNENQTEGITYYGVSAIKWEKIKNGKWKERSNGWSNIESFFYNNSNGDEEDESPVH